MNILENKISIHHNDLVTGIFAEAIKADKKKYTDLFLASLSTNNLSMRSGLSALAVVKSFPDHEFTFRDKINHSETSPCRYCSTFQEKKLNIKLTEEVFNSYGGLATFDLSDIYFFLYKTNRMDCIKPKEKDFIIFSAMLNIILSAKSDETLKEDLVTKIIKIDNFKSNTEQTQALLETLGYCSILETLEQKGLLYEYTNLAIAPRKSHNSDWKYPADWWKGKDKINKKAFCYWFDCYNILK